MAIKEIIAMAAKATCAQVIAFMDLSFIQLACRTWPDFPCEAQPQFKVQSSINVAGLERDVKPYTGSPVPQNRSMIEHGP